MGNHPRPAAWKALGSALAALEEPRRSAGAARAAGAMGIAHRGQRARPVRAALIGGVRNPRLGRHGRAMRRSENDARRARLAFRTIERQLVFRHRAYLREGPATLAEIFVDRHDVLLHDLPRRPAKTTCQDGLPIRFLHAAALSMPPRFAHPRLLVGRRRDVDPALDVLDGT
jgi:hypothetical protein